MFTGIVQGLAELTAIEDRGEFRRHTITLPEALAQDLAIGASVATMVAASPLPSLQAEKWRLI